MTKKAETKAPVTKVVRTSAGLRDILFDELDRLRAGQTNARDANAVARLAHEIVATVQMELEVQKHLVAMSGKPHTAVGLPDPIALGR